MQPSLPIPTDNIYKFACLFGLVLIVAGIFAFVNSYSSALDRKIRYSEVLIPLKAKVQRTKAEDEILAMNEKLIEVTKSNQGFANSCIGVVLGIGTILSFFGAGKWYSVIQKRDDQLAALQLRKLEAEVKNLEADVASKEPQA